MADTMALEISYCRSMYGSSAPMLPSLIPATKKLNPADRILDLRLLDFAFNDDGGDGGDGCGDGSSCSSMSVWVSVTVAMID